MAPGMSNIETRFALHLLCNPSLENTRAPVSAVARSSKTCRQTHKVVKDQRLQHPMAGKTSDMAIRNPALDERVEANPADPGRII